MKKNDRRKLFRLLVSWFEPSGGVGGKVRQRRWCDDSVGRLLREELKKTGNWKNAPRGNPRKGYEGMKRKVEVVA